MVSVARILHDYREAGSLNGLLAIWGFIDDTTFLTKAGHLGIVFRVRGVDFEGLTHTQRGTVTYLQTDARELPTVYELTDSGPSLVNFRVDHDTYVIPKVLMRGYLSTSADLNRLDGVR